ncbi:unnamed protein product [Lactuca saligna]|uniref:Argonaute linker 1 domain-containing protein n=1 Tax=Lactuca saligna TaxID=75948 RepID=A0AA36EL47_LACSI|nr:unnamed protein product [Lactuca saligna]
MGHSPGVSLGFDVTPKLIHLHLRVPVHRRGRRRSRQITGRLLHSSKVNQPQMDGEKKNGSVMPSFMENGTANTLDRSSRCRVLTFDIWLSLWNTLYNLIIKIIHKSIGNLERIRCKSFDWKIKCPTCFLTHDSIGYGMTLHHRIRTRVSTRMADRTYGDGRYFKITSSWYCRVGRSFFSPNIGKVQQLGEGLESWCGFYHSICPTQMGLSLNIDMASMAFIEAPPVIDFVGQLLGKGMLSRPLSDSDHVKDDVGRHLSQSEKQINLWNCKDDEQNDENGHFGNDLDEN